MERRTFIGTLAASLLAAPLAAWAQPGASTRRIAMLGVTAMDPLPNEAFKQGLGEFGYTEGRNVVVEYRHADGRPERLSQLAADLVRLNVDVLFVRGAAALAAAKHATSHIPTVAVDLESHPVAMGFVRDLAQPGANINVGVLDLLGL